MPVEDGPFTVVVIGDSLAEGYWGGLYRKLHRDNRFEVVGRARHSTGLSRPDYYDWNAAVSEFIAEDQPDAAVVSVGANDIQSLYREGDRHFAFGTDAWDTAYAERVETMMKRLLDAGVTVFWMGLPTVRGESLAEKVQHLNRIYQTVAAANGVTFVPVWNLTVDENGEFTSYLGDENGRSRLMRANDGIHFTNRGNELVAQHLLAVIEDEMSLFGPMAAGDD